MRTTFLSHFSPNHYCGYKISQFLFVFQKLWSPLLPHHWFIRKVISASSRNFGHLPCLAAGNRPPKSDVGISEIMSRAEEGRRQTEEGWNCRIAQGVWYLQAWLSPELSSCVVSWDKIPVVMHGKHLFKSPLRVVLRNRARVWTNEQKQCSR